MNSRSNSPWQIVSCILIIFTPLYQAHSDVLDQVAREVCLDIGIRAEISGLDDIALTTKQGDGESGATYSGTDSFFLESNAPVRVMISAAPINNGLNTLPTDYRIDGTSGWLETAGNGPHAGRHSIDVKAQLGAISDQLAGKYTSTLLITIVPQIPEISHCNSAQPDTEPATNSDLIDIEIEAEAIIKQILPAENLEPLPPWATRIMEQPKAEQMFPYLAEYRLWLQGIQPQLSDQAKHWWLFPVDMRLLEKLGINILNNR